MTRSRKALLALAALALLVPLSGCGKHHKGGTQDAALPGWAGDVMGKTLGVQFVLSGQCKGFADAVDARRAGPSPAVSLHGWGWNEDARTPVSRVVFAEASGRIVGAGSGGWARPDVPKTLPDVTSPDVGWIGVAETAGGKLSVAALEGDRKACLLGVINIPPAV